MLFNSLGYILFLFIAALLFWNLPQRFKIYFLALMSVLFYALWRWEFVFLIIFSALIDFVAAKKIYASPDDNIRKKWLALSLAVNLGLLVFFKYTYFILDNISIFYGSKTGHLLLGDLGLTIILPLGISFYTFQTISYSIDVYRKIVKPDHSFIVFFVYVIFWPQLIAGPIVRAGEMLGQLESNKVFSSHEFITGFVIVLGGLFKKVILADNISRLVDKAFYLDPALLNATDVWVASFLFGFQIYFDFSGYSDIAIGSALMIGFKLTENFHWPYMASSPRLFWKRWHISLSSWVRDYLYLPLSGSKFHTRSSGGIEVHENVISSVGLKALFLSWFIMGLWHGAGWNFIAWGIYHAAFICLYRIISPLKTIEDKLPYVSWVITLLAVMAGWIFFRAETLSVSLQMFGKLVSPLQYNLLEHHLTSEFYFVALILTLAMCASYFIKKYYESIKENLSSAVISFIFFTYSLSITLSLLIYLKPIKQFIYFQF